MRVALPGAPDWNPKSSEPVVPTMDDVFTVKLFSIALPSALEPDRNMGRHGSRVCGIRPLMKPYHVVQIIRSPRSSHCVRRSAEWMIGRSSVWLFFADSDSLSL